MDGSVFTVKKWYQALGFPAEFDGEFAALTARYPSLEGLELDSAPENGGKNLLLCLYACEELARQYAQQGIPERIFLDTMYDLVLWTQTHWTLTGTLGISEIHWLKRHYDRKLFRLGRLQFELCDCDREIPQAGVQKGDPVLGVHIPRGGPLTKEECDASFAAAEAFFAKYFPEYSWKCFVCFSWLLDDTLCRFMKPQANALQFQRRFRAVSKTESDDILRFTLRWDATREKLDALTPTNGFTRRILDYVNQGGKFYIAFGYIPKT